METPEDTNRAYIEAEKSSRKFKLVRNDPQFDELMDLFLVLHEKYGTLPVKAAIEEDYRNKNWIKIIF